MKNLDLLKPVRLKNPFVGEEDLIYQITNLNEETERCYIRLISKLPGLSSELAPEELVSVHDLENID